LQRFGGDFAGFIAAVLACNERRNHRDTAFTGKGYEGFALGTAVFRFKTD
jgi:hypothetical protein